MMAAFFTRTVAAVLLRLLHSLKPFIFCTSRAEKMQPPKRSLMLVIAIISIFFYEQGLCSTTKVVVDPEWIAYGKTATVSVTFDPPCPGVSVYRRGTDSGYPDVCVYGPSCKSDSPRTQPPKVEAAANSAGNWLRFTGVNSMANGRYYAKCANNSDTLYEETILIGVKPRILAVEFGNPQFGVQINLTRWQGDKIVPWNSPLDDPNQVAVFKSNHAIPLPVGDSYVTITLGMGVDPNTQAPQATSPKLFTFDAPDFDDNPNMTREKLDDFVAVAQYPMATRIRYRINRNWLANSRMCSLKSEAIATLNPERQDRAQVVLDFEFDPTVANISVKSIGISEEVPVGHSCDCLFTCDVGSCPAPQSYDYEWNFPSLIEVSNKYNAIDVNQQLVQKQQQHQLAANVTKQEVFSPGNVVGYPAQYLLNASSCLELFLMSRDLIRTQKALTLVCRVSSGQVPANRREVKFYDILERTFRDECKSFRRPESIGNARHD